jgi:hypothetical protein
MQYQITILKSDEKIKNNFEISFKKRCIEKNSRSISNLVNRRHENWDKFKINQHSTRSEKSKTRTENAENEENHSIRLKISNFSLKNWNETLNEQSKEFSDWNQDELHATQLIKTMHSIFKFITDEYLIEKTTTIRNIWKKSSLEIEIDSDADARNNHLKKVELILQTNATVFYIDAAYDSRWKISTASCVLYQSSRTTYKTWNLEVEMSINDAKLYAIEKATKW